MFKAMGLSERMLADFWKSKMAGAGRMTAASGENICILYPGRENRDRGPDFLGAVIHIEGCGLMKGDVELHLKARDWRNHGHQYDSYYNGVILHVVVDGDEAALLQNGNRAPTLNIGNRSIEILSNNSKAMDSATMPFEHCRDVCKRINCAELGEILDRAGEIRFRIKAERYADEISRGWAAQVLYRGILRALGYTKNSEPFEELAGRLTLGVLENLCSGKTGQERLLLYQALLLGESGLPVEGHRGDDIKQIRDSLLSGDGMCSKSWRLFRVRPTNYPARRLVGAAGLLDRYAEKGLLDGVLDLFEEADMHIKRLEAGLVLSAPGYCYGSDRNLIGWDRAREIVINVILPFIFAWGESNSQKRMKERALDLYRVYPKAADYGITRDLAGRIFGGQASGLVKTARRQQGLIHLDRTYCRPLWCVMCKVGRRPASRDIAG